MIRPAAVAAVVLVFIGGGMYAQQGAPAVPAATPPAAQAPPPNAVPPAAAVPPGEAPAAPPQTPPAGTAPRAQQPAFRSSIDIVSLNVTVTDQQSHYVTDLDLNDFAV